MNTEQILKVLKNERECIARQSRPLGEMPQCRKDDDGVKLCEYCDLCLPDTEILEVYDFLIEAYSITEIHINVSKEESEKLFEIINRNAKDHTRLAVIPYPDIGECYPTVTLTTEEPKLRCQNCGGELDKFNYCKECGYKLYDVTTSKDIMRQYKSMPPIEKGDTN